MAKTTPLINSFSGGEISPKIDARSDIAKYYSGCRTLENCIPMVEGGAFKAPGTYYVVSTKNGATQKARLVRFRFSTTQVYILEFGQYYIRVYKEEGQIVHDDTPSDFNPTSTYTYDQHVKIGSWCDMTTASKHIYIAAPYGQTATSVNVGLETAAGDTLAVTALGADITISLANATPAKNSGALIQTALRALTTVNGVSVTAWTVTEDAAWAAARPITGSCSYTNMVALNRYYKAIATVTGNASNTSLFPPVETGSWELGTATDPVEVATTYTEAELPYLKFRQSADTLYIVHPAHKQATLTRTSHTAWTLSDITFTVPPSYEADTDISLATATLTPAATTGTTIGFTASEAVFLDADVDRTIKYGASRAIITEFVSTTHVHADILVDFPSTDAIAAGSWFLDASPSCTLTSTTGKVKEGVVTTLTTSTPAPAWRAADVGKYVKFHGSTLLITSFTSTSVVKAKILSELTATTGTVNWTLEVASWDAARGYPACLHFYDGCMWYGGTNSQPTTLWKSRSADFNNFVMGTNDDDAAEFTLVSGLMDKILWIAGDDTLLVGTAEGIWKPDETSTGEPISAQTPPSFRKRINVGVKDLDPIMASDALLWVSRSGRTVRRLGYNLAEERFNAEDMTRLARHITLGSTAALSGVTYMAFQQEPIPILWATRADGQLLGMVYDPLEKVFGWFRIVTDGLVESVEVIGDDNVEDQVWIIVKRTINSATVRYVEYFKPHEIFNTIANAFFVHSGLTKTTSGDTTQITGLGHLEGKTVQILADGVVYDEHTVTSGVAHIESGGVTATIPTGKQIQVGLGYNAIIEPMKLHVNTQQGTSRNKKQKVNKMTVIFNQTGTGVQAGRDSAHLNTVSGLTSGALLSVDRDFGDFPGDWGNSATLYIKQSKPLPMTVLGVVPHISVNDE